MERFQVDFGAGSKKHSMEDLEIIDISQNEQDGDFLETYDDTDDDTHNAKKRKAEMSFGKCKVCNDVATGVHYGISTCEGCKGFYKRSILRNEYYMCFYNNACVLNPKNRNKCKACRFKRCIQVGMSITGIKMGRIPKEKDGSTSKTTSSSPSVTSAPTKPSENQPPKQKQRKLPKPSLYERRSFDANDTNTTNNNNSAEIIDEENCDQSIDKTYNNDIINISEASLSSSASSSSLSSASNILSPSSQLAITVGSAKSNNFMNNRNKLNFNTNNNNNNSINKVSSNSPVIQNNYNNYQQSLSASSSPNLSSSSPFNSNSNSILTLPSHRKQSDSDSMSASSGANSDILKFLAFIRSHNSDFYDRKKYNENIDNNNNNNLTNVNINSHNDLLIDLLKTHKPFLNSNICPNTFISDYFNNSAFSMSDPSYNITSSFLNDKIYQIYLDHCEPVMAKFDRAQRLISQGICINNQDMYQIEQIILAMKERIPEVVQDIVSFCKKVPGLNELSQKDLSIIINNNLFDYFIIFNSILFINGESYMLLSEDMQYTRYWLERVNGKEKCDLMFEFSDEFNSLNLTAKEKALLIVLIFTEPDDQLKDVEMIQKIHEYYLRAILYEFDLNTRDQEFFDRLNQIIQKLKVLKSKGSTQFS